MRFRKLLIIPLVLILNSCQTSIPAPRGQLCIFDEKSLTSICKPLSDRMVKIVSDGDVGLDMDYMLEPSALDNEVPAALMINWLTTDPVSWGEIELYINRLKANQCK